ncbi:MULTISPECIES: hypothetical protein [Sporosarcina]|uniref:Uncharacterized protein n=1 Tax=Sporosarcina gallistercoris TaxID=2762245 RepID=A0ABR8PFR6_9BACL|nr:MULTISPECIES: hypothetical protein [Sporosarcina]MBD7906996.1 hypothetical protein [Sporosarcina gallistercoris]
MTNQISREMEWFLRSSEMNFNVATNWKTLQWNYFRISFGITQVYHKDNCSVKRQQTLGEYYLKTYTHLIPEDVEILKYDEL